MSVKYLLPLIIFIVIITMFWYGLQENPTFIPSPLIGKKVPAFSSPSLFHPNERLTNKIFFGHVSLLNVWASWCYSCRIEHITLINAKSSNEVIIYGLNYKDEPLQAIKWLKERGNPYAKVINDSKGQLAINLGVYGTPETFLIDKYGIIRYKYVGPISAKVWKHDLSPKIKMLQN